MIGATVDCGGSTGGSRRSRAAAADRRRYRQPGIARRQDYGPREHAAAVRQRARRPPARPGRGDAQRSGLASGLNRATATVAEVRSDADRAIAASVTNVNSLLAKFASLNAAITQRLRLRRRRHDATRPARRHRQPAVARNSASPPSRVASTTWRSTPTAASPSSTSRRAASPSRRRRQWRRASPARRSSSTACR